MDLLTQHTLDLSHIVDSTTLSILETDNRILCLYLSKLLPVMFPHQVYTAERGRLNVEGAVVALRAAHGRKRINFLPAYQKGHGRRADPAGAKKNAEEIDFFLCIHKLSLGVIEYSLVVASDVVFEELA